MPGTPGKLSELSPFKALRSKNCSGLSPYFFSKLSGWNSSILLNPRLKKLGAIWTDAPLKLNLPAMDGRHIDTEHLRSLLQKLEFRRLLNNLPENMQTASSKLEVGSFGLDGLSVAKAQLIDSDEKLKKLNLTKAKQLIVHSRAAGRHGTNPQVLVVGVGKEVFVFDLPKLDQKTVNSQLSTLNSASLVGYDVKSDLKLLKNLGIEPASVAHDVLVGAFLLNPLRRAQRLTELASEELGYRGAPFEDIPTEDFIVRAPEFIAVIKGLYEKQAKELALSPKLLALSSKVEWPLIPVLADMEDR